MATIKTDLICNLNQPVNVTYLHGNLFSQDNAGNTINVFVMDNGEPATIGGTVSANVIRSDGQTVAVSGAIEGNKAYVILPQACYAVPGVVHIIIKLTQNTTVTTIAAIVANVYMSTTDAVIDPGTVIPSIQALMALIEEAVDSIPTDYTGLLHTIAADYSSSKTYKVGDYAWESGVLKRCIVPITAAETYTAAHWTNAVIGDDLTNLKSANDEQSDIIRLKENTPLNGTVAGLRYINYSTGELGSTATGETFSHTGYVNVNNFNSVKYKRVQATSATPAFGVAFYDETKTYISGQRALASGSALGYVESIVAVPNNAVFARFTTFNDTTTYGEFTVSGINQLYQLPVGIENAVDLAISGNLWDYGEITDNVTVNATGGTTSNNDYKTTDYIPVVEGEIIYGYGARCACYDASKAFITGSSIVLSSYGIDMPNGLKCYKVPSGAAYFRVCAYKTGVTNFPLYKGTIVDAINYGTIGNPDFVKSNPYYTNLWQYGTFSSNKYIAGSGADAGTLIDSTLYNTTDYIPVKAGDIIYGYGLRFWCYDSQKAIVSGKTGILNNLDTSLSNGMHYYVIPSGVAYFRICALKDQTTYQFLLYLVSPFESEQSTGTKRKLYCLGDSITRGMYAEQGASSSSGPTDNGYPYWIGQLAGYDVENLGVSGSGWANKGGNNAQESGEVNSKTVVDANTFSDADIITLAFGVNDWKGAAQEVVLGDMTSTAGDGTVIGNMKYCIETLVTKKPTAQLIVLLPLNTNRKWTGMRDMTLEENWAFGYAYRNNQTLQDYRTAIRQCAEYYNVKVIDLEEVCPINRLNLRNMCGDGLHPTKAFYKQMGEALANLVN